MKFNKSAIYLAVEKENIEIIQLLLLNEKININILNILKKFFLSYLKTIISLI